MDVLTTAVAIYLVVGPVLGVLLTAVGLGGVYRPASPRSRPRRQRPTSSRAAFEASGARKPSTASSTG